LIFRSEEKAIEVLAFKVKISQQHEIERISGGRKDLDREGPYDIVILAILQFGKKGGDGKL
jgi:hypothetical protein